MLEVHLHIYSEIFAPATVKALMENEVDGEQVVATLSPHEYMN